MTKVHHVPDWAWDRYYMVIRFMGGEWYFFDAWEESEKEYARIQCWEAHCEMRRVADCEMGRKLP